MKTSDRKKEYNTKGKFTKTEKWILLLSIGILVASLVFRAVTWNLNLKILHTTGSDVGVTVTLGFVGVMMYVIFFVAALFPATWRMTEKQKEKMLIFSLGDKARYPIRLGYKESSYQWSVIEEFLDCARKSC